MDGLIRVALKYIFKRVITQNWANLTLESNYFAYVIHLLKKGLHASQILCCFFFPTFSTGKCKQEKGKK